MIATMKAKEPDTLPDRGVHRRSGHPVEGGDKKSKTTSVGLDALKIVSGLSLSDTFWSIIAAVCVFLIGLFFVALLGV